MVRNMVNGVNIFGLKHWEDIKSAYDFKQTSSCLAAYWRYMCSKGVVALRDKRWLLVGKIEHENRTKSTKRMYM